MDGAQWLLELLLLLLLAATLFHALRLERALGVLKRDRSVLEDLVQGFNDSTRQAEVGIERLRTAADGAGRQIARQIETAQRLRDDLAFLTERSDRLAERLEGGIRSARLFTEGAALPPSAPGLPPPAAMPPVRPVGEVGPHLVPPPSKLAADAASDPQPRLRSQAERDLQRALRAGR
jgi:hypothetical protein